MLVELLPESTNGSILITFRSREVAFELVGDDDNIIAVEPMDQDRAVILFQKKLQDDSDNDEVLDLLQHLDYMPLAIS